MKIILVRHTTTKWNTEGKMQGQTDTFLAPQGRREAQNIADALSQHNSITAIISSDLTRAKQTAKTIQRKINVPLLYDMRLRECSFGTIEGLTREQAIAQHGDGVAHEWNDNYRQYDFRRFGGEHRNGVLARHMNVFTDIKNTYAHDSVLVIVGHGRGFNTFLAGIGQIPDLKRGEYKIIEI